MSRSEQFRPLPGAGNTRICSARGRTRPSIMRVVSVSVRAVLARLFWTGFGDVVVCIMTSVASSVV